MQLPIDVEQYERRDQLKKSGLGKVVIAAWQQGSEKTWICTALLKIAGKCSLTVLIR